MLNPPQRSGAGKETGGTGTLSAVLLVQHLLSVLPVHPPSPLLPVSHPSRACHARGQQTVPLRSPDPSASPGYPQDTDIAVHNTVCKKPNTTADQDLASYEPEEAVTGSRKQRGTLSLAPVPVALCFVLPANSSSRTALATVLPAGLARVVGDIVDIVGNGIRVLLVRAAGRRGQCTVKGESGIRGRAGALVATIGGERGWRQK